MPEAHSFHHFGASHLATVLVTAGILIAMIVTARRGPDSRATRAQDWTLAILLLLAHPLELLALHLSGFPWDAANLLPMHLCDWAAIAGFFALVWRRQLMCELTYFWGILFTAQGLLTPSLIYEFPHPMYFSYFLLHSGVVIAALYMIIGLRERPQPGAILRVFLSTQVYVLAAAVVNIALHTNYGFLREKPATGSVMNLLGDWPWYILVIEAVGVLCLFVLYLPFALRKRTGNARPTD